MKTQSREQNFDGFLANDQIQDVTQIGPLSVIKKLQMLDGSLSACCTESADGILMEVITIKDSFAPKHFLERILKNEIYPLLNQEIPGMQKVLLVDFDPAVKAYFVAYEWLDDSYKPLMEAQANLQQLTTIVSVLGELKKQNRWLNQICPETIWVNEKSAKLKYVGLFEIFRHGGLLNRDFQSTELLKWQDEPSNPSPNFQSDIYSVFKSFENLLQSNPDRDLENVFTKSLSSSREERFIRYTEILDKLHQIKIVSPVNHGKKAVKVMVKPADRERFLPILEDMNKGCLLLVNKELSRDKEQIMGWFSTNLYSGVFFVDREDHLFIPMPREPFSPDQRVLKKWFCSGVHV